MQRSLQEGRYRIQDKLGEGGMGAVYKAEDVQLDKLVAIKMVADQAYDDKSIARFEREGQMLGSLSHPHVVTVMDSGTDGDTHFIVMEYVTGQSLKEFLDSREDRRVEPELALDITRQVASALQYTHAHGILHRDLKPSNIIIGDDHKIKLADFGIAKSSGLMTLTQTGDVLGTAAYMAPEQALGELFDARSDLYSLGCILFEMVAGRRPFPGDNAARLIFSHINDTPCLPRQAALSISPRLESIMFKLLAKDPNRRYQSAGDLLRAIEEADVEREPGAVAVETAEKRWEQVMVGRDEELATLKGGLDTTLNDEGGSFFIAGEAGIGKTRLARQLEAYAVMRGARFWRGRARHPRQPKPYEPWIEIMRQAVSLSSSNALAKQLGDSLPTLAKLLPELAENMDEAGDAPSLAPAEQRRRQFDAVSSFFIAQSKVAPLVLFLDDLQWVDETSLQLLDHLAPQVQSERIMLLGAYRTEELEDNSALAYLVSEMTREKLGTILTLKRLDRSQTAEKIRKTFGGQELPEVERLVHEKSDGNPFFIEELLRSLLASEDIFLEEGCWRSKELPQIQIPDSIQAVVQRRLLHLDARTHEVLEMAAMIGGEFEFATLQAALEMDEDSLVASIDEALQAQILAEAHVPGTEAYAFADVLMKEVLYERTSPVRRRRHHTRIGEVIEQIHATNVASQAETLARHFLASSRPAKAIAYAEIAGDKAAEMFAWREACQRYQAALELLGPEQSSHRAGLMQKMANINAWIPDPDQSLMFAQSALELYQQLGNRRKAYEMHLEIQMLLQGGYWDGAREDEGLEHLEAALEIAAEYPESVEHGLILQRIGHVHLHRGAPAETLIWCQRAADLFERLGAPMGTALGTALAYTGRIDEGIAYSEGNWESVLEVDNPIVTGVFGHELALTLALARNVSRATEWAERVLPKIERAGDVIEGLLRRPLLLAYTLAGDMDKAGAMCQVEREIERRSLAGCYFEAAAAVGLYHMRTGQRDKARAYLEKSLTGHRARNTISAVGGCAYALGLLHLEEGRYAESEELLQRSLGICRDGGNVLFEFWILPVLTELYLKLEQMDSAAECVQRGHELMKPDQNWHGLPALVHLASGMVAAAKREFGEAEASFQEAEATNQRYGLTWDTAQVLYQWGIMAGQQKKKQLAQQKLDEATALFLKAGASKDAEMARAARDDLDSSWLSHLRNRLP